MINPLSYPENSGRLDQAVWVLKKKEGRGFRLSVCRLPPPFKKCYFDCFFFLLYDIIIIDHTPMENVMVIVIEACSTVVLSLACACFVHSVWCF